MKAPDEYSTNEKKVAKAVYKVEQYMQLDDGIIYSGTRKDFVCKLRYILAHHFHIVCGFNQVDVHYPLGWRQRSNLSMVARYHTEKMDTDKKYRNLYSIVSDLLEDRSPSLTANVYYLQKQQQLTPGNRFSQDQIVELMEEYASLKMGVSSAIY